MKDLFSDATDDLTNQRMPQRRHDIDAESQQIMSQLSHVLCGFVKSCLSLPRCPCLLNQTECDRGAQR
jgi:hypothetical protein